MEHDFGAGEYVSFSCRGAYSADRGITAGAGKTVIA